MKGSEYLRMPSPFEIRQDESRTINLDDVCRLETDFELPEPLAVNVSRLMGKGSGSLKLMLRKGNLQAEAYELNIDRHGIEIVTSDLNGLRYGIRRLGQLVADARITFYSDGKSWNEIKGRDSIRFVRISDKPALPMRGMHWYLPLVGRNWTFEEQCGLLDLMADWNLNTVILEYGNRFPYRKHSIVSAPDAFSREQVSKLVQHAKELDIDIIPLHQSLGHVEFILRHDAYAGLREDSENHTQWCPLNPKSFELFREMVDDVVELHGKTKFFHIGGDEARLLGTCPKCEAWVRENGENGRGRLYVSFMRKAIDYIVSLGMMPIIWDDMLCKNSELLDEMPREAVIMYWEYWTTKDPSAIFVARPDKKGVIIDKHWKNEWQAELGPAERLMQHFAAPIDFEKELSDKFLHEFKKYLGDEFPKRIRAFPYLEYYQDHGFKVICGGAGDEANCDWHGLPALQRYAGNLFCFARRAAQAKVMGVIATTWFPRPLPMHAAEIMYAGQAFWREPDAGIMSPR